MTCVALFSVGGNAPETFGAATAFVFMAIPSAVIGGYALYKLKDIKRVN